MSGLDRFLEPLRGAVSPVAGTAPPTPPDFPLPPPDPNWQTTWRAWLARFRERMAEAQSRPQLRHRMAVASCSKPFSAQDWQRLSVQMRRLIYELEHPAQFPERDPEAERFLRELEAKPESFPEASAPPSPAPVPTPSQLQGLTPLQKQALQTYAQCLAASGQARDEVEGLIAAYRLLSPRWQAGPAQAPPRWWEIPPPEPWPAETTKLRDWLRLVELPPAPIQVRKGLTITNPQKWQRATLADLTRGPNGPRGAVVLAEIAAVRAAVVLDSPRQTSEERAA